MIPGRVPLAARVAQRWHGRRSASRTTFLGCVEGVHRGLLATRAWLYAHDVLRSRAVACPVVSLGNLTVGGTGKTPAVELAVRTLLELARRPAVVSRGYGRRSRGVQVVADTSAIRLDAEDAGDEPFLLARRLPGVPVVVGANRHDAARLAVDRFDADTIVLDDGFQHRTLRKDLEIVMVRAANPWGNGRLLPLGPLREPLAALARADLVVLTGATGPADLASTADAVRIHAPTVPVLPAVYHPVECWMAGSMRWVQLGSLAGLRLLGFAGIGTPSAFEHTLRGLGIEVEALVAYPDHHWYTARDLAALAARATAPGVQGLVTTEKDWVRLRRLTPPGLPLYVVSVRLELPAGADTWCRAFERVCGSR
jgi:tetraacyldisaccharide 4'-kinase